MTAENRPDVLAALYRGDREEAERLAAGRELDVFEAAALGRTVRLRELLDEEPERANAFGDDGFHPLGLACFFGHADAARLLLARGADVNALSRNEHIQTAAIHAAAASGEGGTDESTRYELVELALDHGADPNLPQGGGFRAIDAARQNGDERVEQLLLARGASG
jgi:ankyrin repeat protein